MMTKTIFGRVDHKYYAEEGFMGVDMHFHTDRSLDSLARIDLALRRAKKLQIGVAMSDHNEVSGALDYFKNKEKIIVVPACELTCIEGAHTIFYFYDIGNYKEFAKWLVNMKKKNPFQLQISTIDAMDIGKRFNAIVCSAHPFGPGATGAYKITTKRLEKTVDLIEAINAYNLHDMNVQAIKWAKKLGKGMTAGSDGHVVGELGQAVTYAKAHDIESFLKEVKKGNSIAVGRENTLFEKTLLGIEKEHFFMGRAHSRKKGFALIAGQLGAEIRYVTQQLRNHWFNRGHHFSHHFLRRHGKKIH